MSTVVLDDVHRAVKLVVERPLWRAVSPNLRLRRLSDPPQRFDVRNGVYDDLVEGLRILYVPWDSPS
jgi:hypothetical protein